MKIEFARNTNFNINKIESTIHLSVYYSDFCCDELLEKAKENRFIIYFNEKEGYIYTLNSYNERIKNCPYCGKKLEMDKELQLVRLEKPITCLPDEDKLNEFLRGKIPVENIFRFPDHWTKEEINNTKENLKHNFYSEEEINTIKEKLSKGLYNINWDIKKIPKGKSIQFGIDPPYYIKIEDGEVVDEFKLTGMTHMKDKIEEYNLKIEKGKTVEETIKIATAGTDEIIDTGIKKEEEKEYLYPNCKTKSVKVSTFNEMYDIQYPFYCAGCNKKMRVDPN